MRLILHNFLTVLKRFTTSSVLNILGLAVAYAVFFVTVVQVYYDFGYNRNFKNADNIYRYTLYHTSNDVHNSRISAQLLREFVNKHPEIINYCYFQGGGVDYDIRDSDGKTKGTFSINITLSDKGEKGEGFVNVFRPEILAGDPEMAFTQGKTMLTESCARKFFGNEDPIGKIFFQHDSDIPITVAAVCKNFPENCSLGILNDCAFFLSDPTRTYAGFAYVELISGGREKILKREAAERQQRGDLDGWQTELTALPDIPATFPEEGQVNLNLAISLLAIGILLIIIAYINFVNFATAMAPVRLKGLNIRRILGESAFLLKFSIVMEAVFLSFIAFSLSILFIYYFNGGVIKEFFTADLSLSKNTGLLLSVAGASVLMGLVAGIYPAFYSTFFKPAMALGGSFAASRSSRRLRSTLIVIQFFTVIFLVVTVGFIKVQQNYMQNKSWGINRENVVYLPMNPIRQNFENFEDELRKNPDILDITYSAIFPGSPGIKLYGREREYNGVQVRFTILPVASNFLRFFDAGLIEGTDFQPEDDYGQEKMIFNSAFIKKYGFDNIIGTQFPGTHPSEMADIIGIAEDINFESLHEPIKPMAFISCKNYRTSGLNDIFIKTGGQNTSKTMDYIRSTWKKFSPANNTVEPWFLDDMHNKLFNFYRQEENLAKLISIFTLITIIVAIMGVYGLILFNVKLKRKTIALHKINGASVGEVILMLNRGFIVQFAIAYAVAIPVAYIVVNRWLENFAYKTPVHWWVFVAGGLLVFLITAATVSRQSYKAATANPIEGVKSE